MSRKYSRAVITIILTTWLTCAAILAVKGTATCLADGSDLKRNDTAIATQHALITEAPQQHRLNKSDAIARAAMHFEPLWLLLLGAVLLGIGTSIKRIARIQAKASLTEGKAERAL